MAKEIPMTVDTLTIRPGKLFQAEETTSQRSFSWHVLRMMEGAFEKGSTMLRGLRASEFAPFSIEQDLLALFREFPITFVQCGVSVTGRHRILKPAARQQLMLIVREALSDSSLYAEATRMEAEVEYLPRHVRVLLRDNGRGVSLDQGQPAGEAMWPLQRMRDRAEHLGARLTIWSRPGAGTEVEISLSGRPFADACM